MDKQLRIYDSHTTIITGIVRVQSSINLFVEHLTSGFLQTQGED